MPMGIYVDRGYRTSLGTPFYDRVREVGELERAIDSWSLVVVYGPRGCGKSELVKYFVSRRRGRGIVIDVRKRVLEDLTGVESVEEVIRGFAELLGLGRVIDLVEVVERLRRALLHRVTELVVAIDEYHLLYPDRLTAITRLEAVAGLLAKNVQLENVKLVLTCSEGFIATNQVATRLRGYFAKYIPIDGLDEQHFEALYSEYSRLRGCSASLELIEFIAGTNPGYLPKLCRLSINDVAWLIESEARVLEEALRTIPPTLAREFDNVAQAVLETMDKPIKPAANRELYELANHMTLHNVLYPIHTPSGVIHKPQIPLYRTLIELLAEKRRDSVYDVLNEAIERATKLL